MLKKKEEKKKTCLQIVAFSFVVDEDRKPREVENEKRTISFEEIVVFRARSGANV